MADDPEEKEGPVKALDEDDIALLKTYGLGPYATRIKAREKDLQDVAKRVNEISGLKESDTGLAPPSRWDLVSDKQAMQEEQPLQVSSLAFFGILGNCLLDYMVLLAHEPACCITDCRPHGILSGVKSPPALFSATYMLLQCQRVLCCIVCTT